MSPAAGPPLARLLQLASPTLPVGAYSYSQGLEAAIEAGLVRDASSTAAWIGDVLALSVARMEAPVLARLCAAWCDGDAAAVSHWNALLLASRETAELHAETVQMGYSLARLLGEFDGIRPATLAALRALDPVAFPTAFACAVAEWGIAPRDALVAYLWAWAENQVMAAVKAVPLGQTDGQRMLHVLGARIDGVARASAALDDDALGAFVPGLALLSCRHETQYSRLFRS